MQQQSLPFVGQNDQGLEVIAEADQPSFALTDFTSSTKRLYGSLKTNAA